MAAGYCGLAIGTDTGGSVRGPAAMCGVVGFKPTAGIWLSDGIFPLSAELDTPGLFTTTAADAAYVFSALGDDDVIIPAQCRLRIGVPESYFQDDLDAEVAAAFSDALDKIVAAGHELVPIDFPSMEPVERYFSLELPLELLETLGRERVVKNSAKLDSLTRHRLMAVIDQTRDASVVASLEKLRDEMEASLACAGLHGWIAPTVPCVAPLQAELRDADALVSWQGMSSRNTRCINALGMCAISLPLSPVLPAGLQLAAPGGSDASLLAHAILLETAVRSGH
jgi:aspartyl-tRNA(Asn)/glutamyl-tRNA(Gln) amidotransferase subunit A